MNLTQARRSGSCVWPCRGLSRAAGSGPMGSGRGARQPPCQTRRDEAESPAAGDPRPARFSGRLLRRARRQRRAAAPRPRCPSHLGSARARRAAGDSAAPRCPPPAAAAPAAALPPPSLPVGSSHPAGRSPRQEEQTPLCLAPAAT